MKEILTHRASHAQQQQWFVEQLVPGEPVYNISFERRYAGRLDPAVVRAAVADLVGRHESLRTRLEVRDNMLWQVVLTPPDQPPVEFTDLSGMDDPYAAYRDLCTRVGTRVFDLGQAPLLRIVHARLGPDADALIVVLHHVIADGVSVEIFMRELTVAYAHRLAGGAPDWPELPVQYADFTAWQEERSNEPAARQDLDYWREQLAGLSTLDLTYGRPRPRRLTQRGRGLRFTIEHSTASVLDEFVRTERATAVMGLLAAYAATLGRVFGSEDVAMATTVAGRPLPEVRDVIGMFVDQVVLRLDLSGGPTFRELVRAVRRVVGEAHDHDAVTFDQIVAAVAPERVAGMVPLAQAVLNLQLPRPASPAPAGAMPEVTTTSMIDTGTVTHDLLLDLDSNPTPYAATMQYRSDVIDDAVAERVCEVFARLLRAGLTEPDRPMWTFDKLWLDERAELESAPPAQAGDAALVHELIERRAAGTPHAPAVVSANGSLDFAGLDAAANRVAHALRERGVGPEVPVLVALPRTAELAVAFLGVLRAGGVCVPVDPEASTQHLAAVTGRSGARLALTLPDAGVALPGSVENLVVDVPVVDGLVVDTAAGRGPGPLSVPVRPDNGAYLMFEPGPAGSPRGVLITHRNLASAVDALLTVLPAGASHLPAQLSTMDSLVWPMLCALAGGGALHLVDEATVRDPQALGALLAARRVDFLETTPAHLTALLAGGNPELRPRRAVVLGGEPIEPVEPALHARLCAVGWDVVALYGRAETGILAAGRLDPAGPPSPAPIPGACVQVLDRWGQPVPPGCRGELAVGGPQVARGYLGAPGATAAAFEPDPVTGARRFRTGALVRRWPDGRLEFCGHVDRRNEVHDAPGDSSGTLDARVELDAAETRHGEPAVATLPEPIGRPAPEGPREPETPVERMLLDGWRLLLPTRKFGVTDDFFDIGGDSILAIHAVGEARRRGLELTVRQILELRTIRALAHTLDTLEPVRRPAPLGITGPTVLRLPAPVPEEPPIPGVTVDGCLLTADQSQVDDWSLGRFVRQLRPAGPATPAGDVPGVLVPAATMAALAGPAHEAFATTTTDLVVAATLAATGGPAVAVADTRREEPAATGGHAVPGLVRVGAVAGEVELIRAVKAALRAPEEDDPAVPGVRVLALPDDVSVTATGDAGTRVVVTLAGCRLLVTGDTGDDLGERVRDHLVRLVEHCVAAEPTYSAADFPDADLDDIAVAGLLAGLDQGVDSEAAP